MTLPKPTLNKTVKLALMLSASATSLCVASTAYAQTAKDEIIVTATRRNQSVQDIPINITAIPGSELEAAGIASGQDLFNLLPGVFASDQGGRTGIGNNISMRGLNANNPGDNNQFQNITEPSVSVYLNDTPLFMNFKLTDMERVEVLRGPQGTLYGSGSVGGTIRYILNKPEIGKNSGSLSSGVSFSDHSGKINYNVDGVANMSLGEKAAIRFVGGYEKLGGVVDMVGLAELGANGAPVSAGGVDGALVTAARLKDADDQRTWYARASILFEPSDNLDILLMAMHQEGEYDADSVRGVTNIGDSSGPEYENSMRIIAPGKVEADLLSMEVNVDLGFASFTSATGYTNATGDFVDDVSGLYDALNASFYYYGYPREVVPSFISQKADVFTQEIRLVSKGDSKLDWIIGGFYKKENKDVSFRDTMLGFEDWANDPTSFGSSLVQPNYTTVIDFIEQVYAGGPLPSDTVGVPYAQDRKIEFEDVAIFGELTYHLTDAWQVTGGVRAFSQKFSQVNRLRFRYFGLEENITNAESISDQLFKVNTSYRANDDTLVYFTWSEGFRHGGANAFPTAGPFAGNPNLVQIRPDEVTNYEAGIKGSLGDKVKYTVSAFLMNWNDVQLDTFLGPLGIPSAINGDTAKSTGFEVDIQTNPSDNFSLDFGYSYVNARLTKDTDLNGDGTADAFDGDKLAGVSDHTFSIIADYMQPAGDWGEVHYHADMSYRSDFQTTFNVNSRNFAALDGFVIINAGVTLNRDNYSIGAFVRNLTDEEGVTGVINNRDATSPFDSRAFFRRPRTYGIQGTIRFD